MKLLFFIRISRGGDLSLAMGMGYSTFSNLDKKMPNFCIKKKIGQKLDKRKTNVRQKLDNGNDETC